MTTNFRPWQLAMIKLPTSARNRVVEVLSYPTPEGTIMVRMVPGIPGTLVEVKVEDLKPHPKHRWVQFAEVSTKLTFPEDMLRYDCAALVDHTINEMGELDPRFEGERTGLRTTEPVVIYRVLGLKNHPWTADRWASFLASIKPTRTIDLSKPE